jgi:hypothetical protein
MNNEDKPRRDENQLERVSRKALDQICKEHGYAAAKLAADRAGILWFASAGTKRK